MKTGRSNIFKAILWLLLIVIYAFFILLVFAHTPIDSDYSNLVLEANDMLHGNVFLKDWTLTGISFVTTDLLYFIAGAFFFGVDIKTYVAAATAMFLMLVLTGSLLVCESGKKRTLRVLALVAIAGFPCFWLTENVRAHTGSVVWCLLGLYLLEKAGKAPRRSAVLYCLSIVVFALSVAGDSVSLLIVILPVLLVALVNGLRGYVREGRIARSDRNAFVVSLTSIAGGLALDKLYFLIGGANKNTFLEGKTFEPFEKYYDKLCIYLKSLFGLFDAGFEGQRLLSLHTVFFFLRSCIILFGLVIIVRTVIDYIRRKECDHINLILSIGFLFISLIFIITNVTIDVYGSRYIAYSPVAFAVMIVRFSAKKIQEFDDLRLRRLLGCVAVALCCCLAVDGALPLPDAKIERNQDVVGLLGTLEEHGLKNGYGGYWDSSVTTVHSNDNLSVRAIHTTPDVVQKFDWFCKGEWYDEYADFVVVRASESDSFGKAVRATFGEPEEIIESGMYNIYRYGYDLSTVLGGK